MFTRSESAVPGGARLEPDHVAAAAGGACRPRLPGPAAVTSGCESTQVLTAIPPTAA
jgi:hypothetical protein